MGDKAAMKRRNFLSGLMAAPLALKALFLAFFAPRCGALPWPMLTPRERQMIQLLSEGKSMKEAVAPQKNFRPAHCSLPRGHKGPHALLFTR